VLVAIEGRFLRTFWNRGRNINQVLFEGWYQWEGEGYKERV
jgi:hypothetical protein